MNRKSLLLGGVVGVAAMTAAGAALAADPLHVAEVVHFSQDENPAKLGPINKKAIGLLQKLGCGCTARVWNRAFGGDAGTTIVIEYPSLMALAQFEQKLQNSAEWAAFWANEVMPSGVKPPTINLVVETPL